MSQQYPPQQPNQPYPPHPQQPYGAPAPAPEPPKKRKVGKIAGLGCLGVIALAVIAGVAGGSSDSDDKASKDKTAVAEDKPKAVEAQKPEGKGDAKAEEQAAPVKITAKKTSFSKSILAEGSNYTSVLVTVTNDSDETIDVNPLFFSITDSAGTKHTAELAVDDKQIDTVKLAPGENISGTITGKGTFTAKYVTYTDGILGDPLRADVS